MSGAAAATAPTFEALTETTGTPVSPEGASMLYTRYAHAASLAAGRRVLELGCGSGQGLGLLRAAGRFCVGADLDRALLQRARAHYGGGIPLVRMTAEALPFRDSSFDLVLFFEALYYVPDAGRSLDELARVTAPGGTLVIVNANPERPDFIRSPHSTHYHTGAELVRELEGRGLSVTLEGAFPVSADRSAASRLISTVRRFLEAAGLVPRTLRGRAALKRLVYGRLPVLPAEIEPGFAEPAPRIPLEPGAARGYKVLYTTARRTRA